MPENTERNDPWAPPGSRPPQLPGTGPGGGSAQSGRHDQPTVTSMPAAGYGVPGDRLPPPPVAPGGPAQPAPGPYGYPAPPPAGGYGYPGSYPGPHHGTYGGVGAWGPGPANGLGVASMVIGIISLVTCFLYGLGVVLGILALVFGVIGRKRAQRGEADNGAMATAGIVTGTIGIVLGVLVLGAIIWAAVQGTDGGGGHDQDHDDPYATSLVLAGPGTTIPG
ncbi:DUF4190 domain-containing protein [Streptomyces somaliensis]|uniref:DUF4190 domain-containing protein n=1 Tax=Streptomyces somaliensis TaxID=78355 RepID=UPI0020CC29C3|nr:DUF4190 domain-containing protein [Streptomyces somaliensis]MCP9944420.1 DUF4190 domain-containing protein [Streptomyces somaliensis]MCP9962350.1 DUF4190 domain-containing protein [Streptomyces somaliensis]MCP9975169.1 DUF4190 domain-containing protein [Streptomyces somaliensis]